ncbi:MAG: hypothetical protein PHN64_05140 [Desulfovibrionaceae bacterium]|nr:hypothetical protein [Desulfovibrionaceae bacterium]
MNEFISVFDTGAANFAAFKGIREEIYDLETAVKRHMDAGLTAEDMEKARSVYAGVQAADRILAALAEKM